MSAFGRSGGVFAGLFLGIAVGTVVTTYLVVPNLPGSSVTAGSEYARQYDAAKDAAAISGAEAKTADSYIASIAEQTVANRLAGKTTVVITTPDANKEDVDNVQWLLRWSGALDGGQVALNYSFLNQDSADALGGLIANTLPAGAQLDATKQDAATHAGNALGFALNKANAQPTAASERQVLLAALVQGGYLAAPTKELEAADAVIVLTGDADGTGSTAYGSTALANFVTALRSSGLPVVLGGRIHAASDTGVLAQVRTTASDNKVSTVDSIDWTYARMGIVLATVEQINGGVGSYGAAASAQAGVPKVAAATGAPEPSTTTMTEAPADAPAPAAAEPAPPAAPAEPAAPTP